MTKIRHKLLLIQQSTVSLIQSIRQIPVEQRHERRNPLRKQIIYKFLIERDTSRVDRVVTSANGDDTTPGDGEAIGFCASKLEERNVFCSAVVGVAGNVAGAAVSDFAGDFAECVPDRGATAVGFRSAFDLVAALLSVYSESGKDGDLALLSRTPRGNLWGELAGSSCLLC
jgi:hypothetical protein